MVINIANSSEGSGGCGAGLENVYPTAAVRYGYMRTVGEFRYPNKDMLFGCGADVVIQTNRGIEVGEMVSLTCEGCDKCVSRDQIKRYVQASGSAYYNFSNGKMLRLATQEDLSDWDHIRAETLRKKTFCQQRADTHKLPMKVIECEHLFGGERIIFYFMSEGRIDFRALVKELAEEFQTRIEMRQVGARDEARLLADFETCGRECCCKNFLKTLKPISMKMAKMQKATLDPAKVSGRCGRLKCCLRYEHVSYEELDRQLPRMGAKVFTEDGAGTVVARQILTQLLQVQTTDGGRISVIAEALISEDEMVRHKAEREEAARAQRAAIRSAHATRKSAAAADGASQGKQRPKRSRRSRLRPASTADSGRQTAGKQNVDSAPDKPAAPPKPSASGAETPKPPDGKKDGNRRRRRRSSRNRGGKPKTGGTDGPAS